MRRVRPLHLLVLSIFAAAAGCSSSDNIDQLEPCGPNGACPAGYTCRASDNRCVKNGTTLPDATATPDAPAPPVPDAPPVVRPDAPAPVPDAPPAPDAAAPPDAPPGTVLLSLTLTGSGAGSVSIVGQSYTCTAATCTTAIAVGTQLTLMATPLSGSRFVSWSGDCSGTTATASLGLSGPRACTATFAQRVTVTAAASGGTSTASVSALGTAAVCTAGTSCTVDSGDTVTLAVKQVTADRFVGWTGTGCSGHGLTAPLDLKASATTTCTASFVDASSTTAPALAALWRSPLGWLDEKGNPPTFDLRPVAGAVYECRTGRTKIATTAASHIGNLPYKPCDGEGGTKPLVIGTPVAADPSGTYRTEVRLRLLDYVSATATTAEYYAHQSLNRAKECPSAFTDAQIFTAALQGKTWNGYQLTASGPFGLTTNVESPFVRLPLVLSAYNIWAQLGDPVPPSPNTLNLLSLRHAFTLNPAGDLLVVRRRFESLRRKTLEPVSSCANGYEFGWRNFKIYGKRFGPADPREAARRIDCVGLVMNAAGQGVCVQALRGALLVPVLYTNTAWEKLLDADSFSPKYRGRCTRPAAQCGTLLPD